MRIVLKDRGISVEKNTEDLKDHLLRSGYKIVCTCILQNVLKHINERLQHEGRLREQQFEKLGIIQFNLLS